MEEVYVGYIELKDGFRAVRDPKSKWFLSYDEWPQETHHVKYAAGWGYILSRDLASYIVQRMDYYSSIANGDLSSSFQTEGTLPPYYRGMLKLEDVMVGYLLDELDIHPTNTFAFRPAWQSCPEYTILKHLDVDAPFMMPIMNMQDRIGVWRSRSITCTTGPYSPASYAYSRWLDHSTRKKPERVARMEEDSPIVFDLDYVIYPLPSS